MANKLSTHIYGDDHDLIGMPCLFQGMPAIPYGSYTVKSIPNQPEQLLVVHLADNQIGGKIRAISGIRSEDLIPVDRHTVKGRKIYHVILADLADREK
jgi:hypothetical protein